MVHPPQLQQDYVFIVVPDSWSFQNTSQRSSSATSPQAARPQPSSSDPRSKFISPAKRKSDQLSDMTTPPPCRSLPKFNSTTCTDSRLQHKSVVPPIQPTCPPQRHLDEHRLTKTLLHPQH
jgi:hypothetical protein